MLVPVRLWASRKVVPLYHALESAALGNASHRDFLSHRKAGKVKGLPDFKPAYIVHARLAQHRARYQAFDVPGHGLFRALCALAPPQLDRCVSVSFLALDLHSHASAHANPGNRNHVAVFGIQLGHVEFSSDKKFHAWSEKKFGQTSKLLLRQIHPAIKGDRVRNACIFY